MPTATANPSTDHSPETPESSAEGSSPVEVSVLADLWNKLKAKQKRRPKLGGGQVPAWLAGGVPGGGQPVWA